ncbi:MAG: hypothetical protein K8L99_17030 [Anaerolineae bacterium]|nr:hypothetical protein [Anaerolineae bacterium]
MDTPLPSNEELIAYSQDVRWDTIEQQKRTFYNELDKLAENGHANSLPLETFSDILGVPVTAYYDPNDTDSANVLLANVNNRQYILGSYVSKRYRSGKPLLKCIEPYNLNPAVNHTNIGDTDDHTEHMRAMGAEIELGLVFKDGGSPNEAEMQNYIRLYHQHAQRLGVYPKLDREACQYQVEAHIAPGIGYQKTRTALKGIMSALAIASEETGLHTTIMSAYPTLSDFKMSEEPKVQTAVDLMLEVNGHFPEYKERLAAAQARYHVEQPSHYVQMFRNQGCHIHLDLAGRSEALGLLTFYTMLHSATAIANAAVLKGGPFVNGTCDPELLCVREYLRRTTVTGRYIDLPLNPHFSAADMENYAALLKSERVNATARALLYNGETPGEPISAMHNPIGRVRPDLRMSKRVCTVESTGMPTNISVSRMAAVLTDFEFTHALIENYFRKHGCDLEPMYEDQELWAILGPLEPQKFAELQDASDRECTDITLTTAAGTTMSLVDFYEMKRKYMHKALIGIREILPRDIDDVYTSLTRMLEPPSGFSAQTVEQYISDSKLRSTGNWGRILRNAFIEEGGTPGSHDPDAVLRVVNRIYNAMRLRYLDKEL